MAGFRNLRELTDAQDAGQYLYASWRKQPTQTTGAGIWFDTSMSPGNPAPNYYIGTSGVFTRLKQSSDGGLRHGGNVNVTGQKKFLRKMMAQAVTSTAVPLSCILMDYIGFYPFVDESITDEQFLDNTTAPSRYADGMGVQMMPIVVAGQTGGQTFTVNYTNSKGVAGRISQPVTMTTQAVNGTVLHSGSAGAIYANNGPFLPLQNGDSGVRSIQSVTIGGVGDVGLFSLVLVKPLATFALFGIDAPTEVDYWQDMASMPEILDDAFLGLVAMPNGTLSGAPINGILETTWN